MLVLHQLQDIAHLTARQAAALLGVTPRALHTWGDTLPERHQQRFEQICAHLLTLGNTPEKRRYTLLDSSHGRSVFRQLTDEIPKHQRIQYTLPVPDLLGVERPDEHDEPRNTE